MAATATEKWESGQLGGKSGEKVYLVTDCADESTARTTALAEAPNTWGSLVENDCQIERVNDDTFLARVTYTPPNSAEKEDGDSQYNFNTRGGTVHVNYSLGTEHSYASSGSAPDFKEAINVTPDGVQGTDIIDAVFEWSETRYAASGDVDSAYIAALYGLTGKTNNASFTDGIGNSFNTGEVLFLGAEGTKLPNDVWEITFHFAARPNTTTLQIGSITSINKEGWEYVWVYFEEVKDTTANITVKRPLYVFVERVYDEGDFSTLFP